MAMGRVGFAMVFFLFPTGVDIAAYSQQDQKEGKSKSGKNDDVLPYARGALQGGESFCCQQKGAEVEDGTKFDHWVKLKRIFLPGL